jgi:nitrate reductase gamma subunit
MSNSMDFLLWVRGPALDWALTIFVIGVFLRFLEIFLLGRAPNYAEPRQGEVAPGLRTLFRRFVADPGTFKRSSFNVIVGYIWHIGFLVALLLFVPHIELFKSATGLSWPGLPNPVVDSVAAVTLVALVAMLLHRLRHPVMRHISTFEDYLVWAVTFLPLLTGYLAYHRLVNPYPLILGIHILTVELFLVVFPFTKLMHALTAFVARWFNGATFGRKGVES